MNTIRQIISDAIKPVLEPVELAEKIQSFYLKHGHEWQPENLIALRDISKANDNTFSDCFAVVTDTQVFAYTATTVYGTKWTDATRKKFGITQEGNLCLGFYPKLWTFGMHNGRAFKQVGVCDWFIDGNLNKRLDPGEKVFRKSRTFIDIHRPGVDGQREVNYSSGGCINPRYYADLDEALRVCGWVGVTPPKKLFNGFITDTESFPYAADLLRLIKRD